MDTDKLRNGVIDLADQDYLGLYEIVWQLNSWHPEMSEAAKIEHSRPLALQLLKSGDYDLYRTDEWPARNYVKIEPSQWTSILERDESFRVPQETSAAMLFWITRRGQ